MKKRPILAIAVLAALSIVAGAGYQLRAQNQPAEGTAESCDNYFKTPAEHRCDCARSREMCDRNDPEMKSPGATCKTYCSPEKCKCANGCAS